MHFFCPPISGQFQFQVLAQFLQIRQIFCDFFFLQIWSTFHQNSVVSLSLPRNLIYFFLNKNSTEVFFALKLKLVLLLSFFSFLRWLKWPKVKSSEILNVYWQFQDKGSWKCFANSPKYFILTKKSDLFGMQLSISIMLSPRLNYSTIFQHLLAGSLFQKYNYRWGRIRFCFCSGSLFMWSLWAKGKL